MNISEFERTKPKETMKALNALIKKVDATIESNKDPYVSYIDEILASIKKDLFDIKTKLKNGE